MIGSPPANASAAQLAEMFAEMAARLGGPQFKAPAHAGTADTTPSLPYYSGASGGMFGFTYGAHVNRDIISLAVQPRGIASILPAFGNTVEYPLFGYIGDYGDLTGDDPDGVCDDGPEAGPNSSCLQMAQFGRYTAQTRTLELNAVGRTRMAGESIEFNVINDPLLRDMGPMINPSMNPNAPLNREVLMRINEMSRGIQRKVMRQVWDGNPTNNSAGGGYKEYPGLKLLVGTGKVDAETNTACPMLDSLMVNAQNINISDNGPHWIQLMVDVFRILNDRAERTGLDPVEWVAVMREGAFYELTRVWPCAYAIDRCDVSSNTAATINLNAGDQVRMRDDMYQNRYLLIDGRRLQVVFDDALTESSVGVNEFSSDIFILPLRFAGGRPGVFFEYFDFSGGVQQAITDGRLGDDFWTDTGRYLWHKKTPINWCVQWIVKWENRLILRVPQLAARIRNVSYRTLPQHLMDSYSDQPYFPDFGGVEIGQRPGPSLYKSWS